MSREEYNYKRRAIKAAKELCYKPEVINLLREAQNEKEVERIMVTARKSCL